MVYFLIGVVLLLVIAPIFTILPSKHAKAVMELRRRAMGGGGRVPR